MSPRRTKALHEFGHRQHLCPVVLVDLERGDLGGERLLVVKAGSCLNERSTDSFRPRHASCLELAQRPERGVVESSGERTRRCRLKRMLRSIS